MMAAKNMQDLLIEELRDIYHAEKQLTRALPKMARAASNEQLKQAFTQHLEETQGQIERLEQVFEKLDTRTRGKHCHAMEGLIEEAKEIMEMGLTPELLDVALIAAAQKVEHYEIAGYGTLVALAQASGFSEAAQLLQETLDEEKKTDQLLNKLAISDVNMKAMKATA
jgi:ferritin-like metal-binding protein YciE